MSCSLPCVSNHLQLRLGLRNRNRHRNHPLFLNVSCKKQEQAMECKSIQQNKFQHSRAQFLSLSIQVAGVLTAVAGPLPALGVTGVNYEFDLVWTLIQSGISAFFYFIVVPPIIMNWLRIRWYRRNLLEMYFQFLSVFLFFPGILVWAPFLNFRKFPRDPSLQYPWSVPENPSLIKGGFKKFPWATPEDYD